ncbi:MFS transporter [Conchiformibius kuhniae]|uniref:MFS transporter n=1 Tax=Conchiformibius kuhniae TaxID=211502 RepID=A0A8T9MU96_9NEIS|nr:MFS transporter [Conchiformibius kuhniae]
MKPFAFAATRRFAPLFGTQFLGAFNDNLFKTALFVLIGFHGLGQGGWLPAQQLLNVGALLFVLPYFLFSALAGQLATRYDKAALARWTKVLEMAVMALAGVGLVSGSAVLLLACLFVMGTQSAFFGPVKYAAIPEYLHERELVTGNGLIESGTFLAILFGQIAGTLLAGGGAWATAAVVLLLAAAGWACSLMMPALPPQRPDLPVDKNLWRGSRVLLRDTFARRDLTTAIVGISWFWLVGSVYTTQLPTLVRQHLHGNDHVFNLLLALFSLGIAAGSLWCAKLSGGRLQVKLAVAGAGVLAVCGAALAWLAPPNADGVSVGLGGFLTQAAAYPVMLLVVGIGIGGGLFSVPLYTWLQTAGGSEFCARAVAANNIVNGFFMVAGAVFSAAVLWLLDDVRWLYGTVAAGNVAVMAYLCARLPDKGGNAP